MSEDESTESSGRDFTRQELAELEATMSAVPRSHDRALVIIKDSPFRTRWAYLGKPIDNPKSVIYILLRNIK